MGGVALLPVDEGGFFCSHKIEDITGRVLPYEVECAPFRWEAPTCSHMMSKSSHLMKTLQGWCSLCSHHRETHLAPTHQLLSLCPTYHNQTLKHCTVGRE